MPFPYIAPEWFQVIFTGILVCITVYYAISTHNMAESTKKMADISAKQILFLEKERLRHVIIDMVNVYMKIYFELKKAKKTLESGYVFYPDYPDCKLLTKLEPILESQVHIPDIILEKFDEKIKDYTQKYDQLLIEGQKIIDCFIKQKPIIWDKFTDFCDILGKEDSEYNLNKKVHLPDIFLISLTSPNLAENHVLYGFFKNNRDELTNFFNKNGFFESIKAYNKFREELIDLTDEYTSLLDDLIREWKREYSIIDSDLKDPTHYSV